MSHEIRTPLNAVLGFAQIGQFDRSRERAPELFGRILIAGDHLLGVINDILDFSKIDAGMMRIELKAVDLDALIEGTVAMLRPMAEGKGLDLNVVRGGQGGPLPRVFQGDALRLSQVLTNLIANAVKFTPPGGQVRLAVDCQGGVLEFAVTDTGIGISAEDLRRLFTPFEQVDGSTSRRFGGTGLGLAISKRLTEAMGGTIGVDSRLGQGSRFVVRLPLDGLEAAQFEPGPAAAVTAIAEAAAASLARGASQPHERPVHQ